MPRMIGRPSPARYTSVSGRCSRLEVFNMPDQPPLVRQWVLLKMLCSRHYGVSVREAAEELGVSQKTIRRDLESFQAAGFPMQERVEERGRKAWRIETPEGAPGLSFAFDEAVALYLGRHLLEPLAGTLFWEAAQSAFRKIRASLSTSALSYIERFSGAFHQTMLGTSDYSKKTEIIDHLMVGIEDSRAVFITYQSLRATEPVTYDVYPYGLTYHRGALYLVGLAPQHDEIRHWKVNRIERTDPTEFRFQRPEGFDLQEHFAKTFGVFHGEEDVRVRIRFAPQVARYVEESHWHPSQKLAPQKDGGLVAAFDLGSVEEIKRWVLSFGRDAEVL